MHGGPALHLTEQSGPLVQCTWFSHVQSEQAVTYPSSGVPSYQRMSPAPVCQAPGQVPHSNEQEHAWSLSSQTDINHVSTPPPNIVTQGCPAARATHLALQVTGTGRRPSGRRAEQWSVTPLCGYWVSSPRQRDLPVSRPQRGASASETQRARRRL